VARFIALLALLALALGAFLLLDRGRDDAPAEPGTVGRSGARGDGETALEADPPPTLAAPERPRVVSGVTSIPGTESVSGRVTWEDGRPASGAEVLAVLEGTSAGLGAKAGADGAFEIGHLLPGTYELNAWHDRGTRRYMAVGKADAPSTGAVLVLMDSHGLLVLRLEDPAGRPAASARAALIQDDVAEDLHVEGGAATTMAPSREAWIDVWPAASEWDPVPAWGAVRHGPIPPGEQRVTIRLPPGREIRGRVLDPDGAPARGVTLEAKQSVPADTRGATTERVVAWASTDAQGAFVLRGLGAAEHAIAVRSPDSLVVRDPPFAATPGGPSLDVRLRRGVTARITVLDQAGLPMARAPVILARDPGVHLQDKTGDDGVVEMAYLDPATPYRMHVQGQHGRQDWLSWDDGAWMPADTVVRLPAAYVFRGRVRDAAGRPVAGAHVSLDLLPAGRYSPVSRKSDADGVFEFDRMPSAEGVLRAGASREDLDDSRKGPRRAETRASAGVEAVLVIDPGVECVVRIRGWDRREFGLERASLTPEDEYHAWPRSVSAEGEARFRALHADRTYTLWVGPLSDGRLVYRPGIRPDGRPIEVTLEQGRKVWGRVTAPDGATDLQVRVFASGFEGHATVDGEGKYVLDGLPDVVVDIRAYATIGDGQLVSDEREIRPPAEVNVEMRLEEPPRRGKR
jgi:hypothetical protein